MFDAKILILIVILLLIFPVIRLPEWITITSRITITITTAMIALRDRQSIYHNSDDRTKGPH